MYFFTILNILPVIKNQTKSEQNAALCTMGISLTDDRDRLQQMQVIFQIISVSFVVKTFALYVLFIQ